MFPPPPGRRLPIDPQSATGAAERSYAGPMRVAFVTTDDPTVTDEDVDRPAHERAFAAAGIDLEYRSWTMAADWEAYDLVVIRSPWDYPEKAADFLAWLGSVEHLPTLMNPAPLIGWNLDKRYLAELDHAGVPTVPTGFADSLHRVDALLSAQAAAPQAGSGPAEVVVKPTISAGSRNTGRFAVDDPAARALAKLILGAGGTVMIQPAIASVAERGEVGVIVFDGEISHAIVKAPILDVGGTLLGGSYTEAVTAIEPSAAQREATLAAVDVVASIAAHKRWLNDDEQLLYGRYDLVTLDDGTEALLEAELFEPSFFLDTNPGSPARFVEAVRRRAIAVADRR